MFFKKTTFGYLDSLMVPNFRIFKNFCEKCYWNFDRNCIESIDGFVEWYERFNNINSSNPPTQGIFLFTCVFNFFHQCLIVLSVEIFHLLSWTYSLEFHCFWGYCKWNFLCFSFKYLLLVYRNVIYFVCWFCIWELHWINLLVLTGFFF